MIRELTFKYFRGSINPNKLFHYIQNKDRFVKKLKRKYYQSAIHEIEADLVESGSNDSYVSMNHETSPQGSYVF